MKIIITISLILNLLILSSCTPIISTVSTVNTAISVGNDRRTAGVVLDDKTIYLRLESWAADDKVLNDSHLNFLIYDKNVLISGEVPNEYTQSYVRKQAPIQVPQIKQIFNETKIAPNSSILSRAKDASITLQVEALFFDQDIFHPTHVRVMTEARIVYLMGALTKREADKAAKVAAKAKGVFKVVKMFDYLKNRPYAEIERDRLREVEAEREEEMAKKRAELKAEREEIQKQINALDGTVGTDFSPR